jgi:hypothetical protein
MDTVGGENGVLGSLNVRIVVLRYYRRCYGWLWSLLLLLWLSWCQTCLLLG